MFEEKVPAVQGEQKNTSERESGLIAQRVSSR